ncbi:unnamed protein product [Lasius platythorax]|uniref:DUF4806 domain-containing protein n=1 Tax=Lasius platythorax TaxID=488582 RepID=A0AAV2NP10_9HYME
MTWLVVKFNVEDTVEAVPNTWYIKKNFQCYWPPEGTVKNVIIDFIKKKHTPEANWILYEATLLGVYDNYKTAQQKANKARNTNNLSSNNEELKQKYRRNKKKNRRHSNKSDSEYELSTETEISSSDDVRYPNIPNEQIDSSDKMRVDNNIDQNIQLKASTSNAHTTSTSGTIVKTTSLYHKSGSTFEQDTISEKEFQKRVLRELYILTLKIDDISETINVVLKNKADEINKLSACSEAPDIFKLFPVNDDALLQLEEWLSSEENKKILSQNLSRIGGLNVKEVVRRIMYRVFTNEVGMSYSWEGAKKKKVFKNLAVASVIMSSVRLNKNTQECTDSEIICFIKAWLVRSKDRFNNNNKNKNIVPEEDERTEELTH